MFLVVGILVVVVGLVLTGYSVWQAISMRGGYELDARIVDYKQKVTTHYDNGHRMTVTSYAPVYEYVDAGETKRHTSVVFISVMPKIGEETTIFISGRGKVIDKRSVVGMLAMGILLVVIGGALTAVVGLKG